MEKYWFFNLHLLQERSSRVTSDHSAVFFYRSSLRPLLLVGGLRRTALADTLCSNAPSDIEPDAKR